MFFFFKKNNYNLILSNLIKSKINVIFTFIFSLKFKFNLIKNHSGLFSFCPYTLITSPYIFFTEKIIYNFKIYIFISETEFYINSYINNWFTFEKNIGFIIFFFFFILIFLILFQNIIVTIILYIFIWLISFKNFLFFLYNPESKYIYNFNTNNYQKISEKELIFESTIWGIYLDFISSVMFFIIITISFLVYIYSIEYMKNDPKRIKFLIILILFSLSMIVLIISPNLIQLFIGWEGVGLTSFLLINFWSTRIQANKAAFKALIYNKIGDSGLLMSISIIVIWFKTFNFETIFILAPYLQYATISIFNYNIYLFNIIVCGFLIACMGKSAQIGLHQWLPDAMEGPTPVSALLHAATMVTAGVFVLIRCGNLIILSIPFSFIIMFIGSLTAFFAATVAITQTDIKKIIAYSTCSQLGFMVFACGQGNFFGALFHLFNHAFFKALLFLLAGIILHILLENQNLLKMGKLIYSLPILYICFSIATLSIIGLPFFSGSFSKNFILDWGIIASFNTIYLYLFLISLFLLILATIGTILYSLKLWYLIFWNNLNLKKIILNTIESLGYKKYPFTFFVILFLSFLSILSGFLFQFFFNNFFYNLKLFFFYDYINVNTLLIKKNIFEINYLFSIILHHFILFFILFILFFILVFYGSKLNLYYSHKLLITNLFLSFYKNFAEKWYFDKLYNFFSYFIIIKIFIFFNKFDIIFIEKIFAQFFNKLLQKLSQFSQYLSINSISFHFKFFFISFILLLFLKIIII